MRSPTMQVTSFTTVGGFVSIAQPKRSQEKDVLLDEQVDKVDESSSEHDLSDSGHTDGVE